MIQYIDNTVPRPHLLFAGCTGPTSLGRRSVKDREVLGVQLQQLPELLDLVHGHLEKVSLHEEVFERVPLAARETCVL